MVRQRNPNHPYGAPRYYWRMKSKALISVRQTFLLHGLEFSEWISKP